MSTVLGGQKGWKVCQMVYILYATVCITKRIKYWFAFA